MLLWNNFKYIIVRALNRRPSAIRNSSIDKTASIGNGAQIVNCKIGKFTYIYGTSVIQAEIGSFCSIAAGSSIGGGSHPTNWVSTSPAFYKGKNVLNTNFGHNDYNCFKVTTIGNDVWIGENCKIKGGVQIGDGAVIGMGSVVTKDIPPYEIWAGNPAKLIRKRFDEDTINRLLALRWWELSNEKLFEYGKYFNDPHKFIEILEEDLV